MSIVARGLGNDAILVTWGLGRRAPVGPLLCPVTPTVARAVFTAGFLELAFQPSAITAGTVLSATATLVPHQASVVPLEASAVLSASYPVTPYLVSPAEISASVVFSGIFGTDPSRYQAANLVARTFLTADFFGQMQVSAQALIAGTEFAAAWAVQGVLAQAAACVARANCTADTTARLLQYIGDLHRANLPQEVTDEDKDRLPIKVGLPPELDKLKRRLPDKLPTLDHW